MMPDKLPILFACSGCSNAGQLANQLALALDQQGIAQMSCLAGVGAGKPHFLKQLVGRQVWVIDGCPIKCSLGVFDQIRERIDVHIRLHELGIRKNAPLLTECELQRLVDEIVRDIARQQTQGVDAGGATTLTPMPIAPTPTDQDDQAISPRAEPS